MWIFGFIDMETQAQPIINRFPSLTIPAHARGWAMGGTGIAGANDNQQLSYNIGKTAFAQNLHQASISYLPWMRSVTNDSRLLHVDYLGSMGNAGALGFSINYLDLGNVAIRDENGATLGLSKANDFNIGSSYALQLGANASIGVALRLLGSMYYAITSMSEYSMSGDIGFYQFADLGEGAKLEWGAVVSNLGPSINLPGTAGIGLSYSKQDESGNQFSLALDATRLLKDDWNGLRVNVGAEYGFAEQFFLRGGASIEDPLKGNRRFFSLGAGYKGFMGDQQWQLDLHYLIPFGMRTIVSPYQDAFGLSFSLNVGNFK